MATWVLDLDGVVWRGSTLLPGADAAVARLLAGGERVVFCTNHAQSPATKATALARLGVPACPVVTSGEPAAAAVLHGPALDPGATVWVLGDPTLVQVLRDEDLAAVDVHELPDGTAPVEVAAVVVGANDRWDRSRIGMVADAVRSGARFLTTNDDPTFPTVGEGGQRLLPGNGALTAAVEVAAGAAADVTGKPHAAMADLLVERHGPVDVVVGDKPETDGQLAVRLGARFGLVLSGVTARADLPVDPEPWIVGEDLAELVRLASVG